MSKKNNKGNQIVIFKDKNNQIKLDVYLDEQLETVWLNLKQISELFDRNKSNISRHIKNILEAQELDDSVVAKNATTASDGKSYIVEYYNLDMIISIGYRVNSKRAVEFRKWATSILSEYIVKGYALNDELLKNGGRAKYFNDLLFRIRDIRSSEKNLYSKLLEIYATSVDYDPSDEKTIEFFKKVQNKLHFAVSHKTAAEIIFERANHKEILMGLTSFKGNLIKPIDTTIAKNYLNEEELKKLNLLVSLFLDTAELMAFNKKQMYMKDWIEKLDNHLKLVGSDILNTSGSISHEKAIDKALDEYQRYKDLTNLQLSDVEKEFLKKIKELNLIKKDKKE